MVMMMKSEKERYTEALESEFQRTLKLLREYPAGKEDFKPAEISRTARELVWMLHLEEHLVGMMLDGELTTAEQPQAPNVTMAALVAMYEKSHRAFVGKLGYTQDDVFGATRKFPVGKGQMADMSVGQIAWFMLMDHIHHRGQFSVYLRMVGGKVPSIYGPSADEPWR